MRAPSAAGAGGQTQLLTRKQRMQQARGHLRKVVPVRGPVIKRKKKPPIVRTRKPLKTKTCKCPAGKCYQAFHAAWLARIRDEVRFLEEWQRKVLVTGLMAAFVNHPPYAVKGGSEQFAPTPLPPKVGRQTATYRLFGIQLCRAGLLNVLGIGSHQLHQGLIQIRDTSCLVPPRPKRSGHKRASARQQRQHVISFIRDLAFREGLPNPAGRGVSILLPIKYSRPVVYSAYIEKYGWWCRSVCV